MSRIFAIKKKIKQMNMEIKNRAKLMSRLSAIKERDKNAPDNSNCFTVDIKKWVLQHSTYFI